MGKKKYEVRLSDTFKEQYDSLSPKDKKAVDKAIERIAQNPKSGEPSYPCGRCGEYFFWSDKICPFCGWKVPMT